MGHRLIRRMALGLLCGALGVTVTGCDAIAGRARTFEPVRGPLIAVLGQAPPRVLLLDADTLEQRAEIRLRSQSIGMTAVGDTIVTAQCGGLAGDSDSRMGIIAPHAGRLEYLDTGVLDPEEVWASGEDWCLVLNGLIDNRGMRCERIDIGTQSCESLSLPAAGVAGTGARSTVWILRKGVTGEQDRVTEEFLVFGRDGDQRVVVSESTGTVDLCGFGDAVVTVEPVGHETRLVRRDANTGRVLGEARLAGIEAGLGCAWPAGSVLVVADLEHGEGREVQEVVLVDPVTLQERRRIQVDGLGAVGAAGDRQLVVCEADGDVVLYSADDGHPVAGTHVSGREEELLEVVYVRQLAGR